MKYTEEQLDFFEKINFFNRYKNICDNHINNFDDFFEKTKKIEILAIFSKLGYQAKYNHKESFYRIDEITLPYEFGFWTGVKSGMVEFGIDGKNIKKDTLITLGNSSFSRLEYTLGYDIEKPKKATFKSYNELEVILKAYLKIYEDFKLEFLKEY